MGRVSTYSSKEEAREARLARRRDRYQKNPEKYIASTRSSQIKRKANNPNIDRELRQRELLRDPLRDKRANLAEYGLSLQQFNNLKEVQNNLCAICDGPQVDSLNGKLKELCVDHDPKKSKKDGVRMLLCSKCNRALGLFQEDITILLNAIAYIEYWKGVYTNG